MKPAREFLFFALGCLLGLVGDGGLGDVGGIGQVDGPIAAERPLAPRLLAQE